MPDELACGIQVGRILVVPAEEPRTEASSVEKASNTSLRPNPIMLIALNATDTVDWETLETKVCLSVHWFLLLGILTPLLDRQRDWQVILHDLLASYLHL